MDFQLAKKENFSLLTTATNKTMESTIIWLDYSMHVLFFLFSMVIFTQDSFKKDLLKVYGFQAKNWNENLLTWTATNKTIVSAKSWLDKTTWINVCIHLQPETNQYIYIIYIIYTYSMSTTSAIKKSITGGTDWRTRRGTWFRSFSIRKNINKA